MLIWERMQHLPTPKAIPSIATGELNLVRSPVLAFTTPCVLTGVGHLSAGRTGPGPVPYQTAVVCPSMSKPQQVTCLANATSSFLEVSGITAG